MVDEKTQKFIQKYKSKYPNTNFIFDKTCYTSYKCKVEIGCEHGYWFISSEAFLVGQCSCKQCSNIKRQIFVKNKNAINENNLLKTHPDLCLEWHPTENGNKKPEHYTYGSHEKIWWQCLINPAHKWLTAIKLRAKNTCPCPYCANRVVDESNNLLITHPELCKQWDYETNKSSPTNYSKGSNKIVSWICEDDLSHKWKSSINNRTKQSGKCPFCSGKKVSNSNNFKITNPELCKEWDYELNGNNIPEMFTKGSNYNAYWVCIKDKCHKWQATISNRVGRKSVKGTNCPFCSNKRVDDKNNLTITNPLLCEEWDYENNDGKVPEDYTYGCSEEINWKCIKDSNHKWCSSILSRKNSGCPYCGNKRVDENNNLLKTHPIICKEWDYELNKEKLPEQYTKGSNEKVWWKCLKNSFHKWITSITKRCVDGTGCPYCKNVGENFTRYCFEKLFNKSFSRVRPDFLKNPKTKRNLELDGFCEELLIAFEYQGNQHEKIVSKFKMTQEKLDKTKQYDQFKRDKCIENNVKLIEVPQFGTTIKKDDIKDYIIQKCNELDIKLPNNVNEIEISYNDFIMNYNSV